MLCATACDCRVTQQLMTACHVAICALGLVYAILGGLSIQSASNAEENTNSVSPQVCWGCSSWCPTKCMLTQTIHQSLIDDDNFTTGIQLASRQLGWCVPVKAVCCPPSSWCTLFLHPQGAFVLVGSNTVGIPLLAVMAGLLVSDEETDV